MSNPDVLTYDYVSNKEVFADIVNYFLFNGKHVVKPEDLQQENTKTTVILPSKKKKKPLAYQRFRDNIYSVMNDSHCTYVILGIENQSHVHYAMPVRNMLYDALTYADRIKHDTNDDTPYTSEEFLAKWHKDDRLTPVITIVVNWSGKPWDGATSLHEMFKLDESINTKYIPNYELNIIDPAKMSDEDIDKFTTDFGKLCKYLQCCKDKERFSQVMTNEKYRTLRRSSAILLNQLLNLKLAINDTKEEIDVCLAMQQICEESREKGFLEGQLHERQNQQDAIQQIREECREKGFLEGQLHERKHQQDAIQQIRKEIREEGTAIYMMKENKPLQSIINETHFDKQALMELAKNENIPYNFA